MPRIVKNHREEPHVVIGDKDQASDTARVLGLSTCRQINNVMEQCTRPAGHDEDPGAIHVYAPFGIVRDIWEDTP